MRYLFIYLLSFVLQTSCKIHSTIEIAIENKTKNEVDTIKVFLQRKEFQLTNLTAGSISKINVAVDSLDTNPHDFTIQATGIVNHNKKINGFYYTDLSGKPGNGYSINIYYHYCPR